MPRRRAAERTDNEDLVRVYLNQIGRYPLLTKDDEARLGALIEAGQEARARLEGPDADHLDAVERRRLLRRVRQGEEAERQFVQSNLRLVVSIAKRYQSSGLPLLDLVQEGNLGLMHAVQKFDYRKGFKFSTYATWWIRQAITRGVANTARTIRLPVHAGDTVAAVNRAQARLESELGRPPTVEEIAADAHLEVDQVRDALVYGTEVTSLSDPVRDDGEVELGDLIPDPNAPSPFEEAARSVLPAEVERLLATLDEREREVLRLRFGLDRGEPRTLEEVGRRFNLTRERIRQIETRALSKLRHPSTPSGARDLLS